MDSLSLTYQIQKIPELLSNTLAFETNCNFRHRGEWGASICSSAAIQAPKSFQLVRLVILDLLP